MYDQQLRTLSLTLTTTTGLSIFVSKLWRTGRNDVGGENSREMQVEKKKTNPEQAIQELLSWTNNGTKCSTQSKKHLTYVSYAR